MERIFMDDLGLRFKVLHKAESLEMLDYKIFRSRQSRIHKGCA